jgi:hypothetical protein
MNGEPAHQTLFTVVCEFPKTCGELTANLSRIAEWTAAGEHARAQSLPEQRPFVRSQTLKSDRLRQPAVRG